jgi:hypothetical protein
MQTTPVAINLIAPAIAAIVFVFVMSFVREPTRRTLNAVLAAGAVSAYLSGGLGVWELLYPLAATPIVYAGLKSYRYIGIAWLMHSCWDAVHHLWGNPIWPFMPTSSLGCLIFDAGIAMWFLAGAPSLVSLVTRTMNSPAAALSGEGGRSAPHQP